MSAQPKLPGIISPDPAIVSPDPDVMPRHLRNVSATDPSLQRARRKWLEANERTRQGHTCEYEGCTELGIENHHYLPREVGGRISNFYHQGWLCKEHHDLFHQLWLAYVRSRNLA